MAFISKIEDYGIRAGAIPSGQVDSTSTATAFTATVPGIYELSDGICMFLKNGVIASSSNGFTLNINGLGAKPSYSSMYTATASTTIFAKECTMLFIYDSTRVSGGCWVVYYYNTNTNTIGYNLRHNKILPITSDAFVRYRLLFTSADNTKLVPANTSTSTNATAQRDVNQRPINPFGDIYYYDTTTAISAGATPSITHYWTQYESLTFGYSFNRTGAALTLTAKQAIYIKCTPQNDGSAIIDATEPYTQSLPTTDDGYIYIYLGVAVSATAVELNVNHPVFYHDGQGIRGWTGNRTHFGTTAPTTTIGVNGDTYIQYSTNALPEIFPIGAIYMSVSATNPGQYFAGTWERIAHGRTLIGAAEKGQIEQNSAGNTVLSSEELNKSFASGATGGSYAHSHDSGTYTTGLDIFKSGSNLYFDYNRVTGATSHTENTRRSISGTVQESSNSETSSTGIGVFGESGEQTAITPYLVCYIWQRVA